MNTRYPVLHKYAGQRLELGTYVPSADTSVARNTVANKLTMIHERTVPKGVVWAPNPNGKGVIQLAHSETIEAPGDNSAQATTYPIVRIPKLDDTGLADGVAQDVVLSASPYTARTISAVADHVDNPSTGSITCSDETNADHVYSYVPYETGRIIVKVEAPGSMGDVALTIFETDARALFAQNQERGPNMIVWPWHLPPGFAIRTYLDAAWAVSWKDRITAGNNLPWARVIHSVIQRPLRAYAVPGEPKRGYTVAQDARAVLSGRGMP